MMMQSVELPRFSLLRSLNLLTLAATRMVEVRHSDATRGYFHLNHRHRQNRYEALGEIYEHIFRL
jgi:hypothetical protein